MKNILTSRGVETELLDRLTRIEELMNTLAGRQMVKDFYTVEEVAKLMNRSAYCVREWCRGRRVHATKAASGRGRSCEWRLSHAELQRLRNEGLLPLLRKSNTTMRVAK